MYIVLASCDDKLEPLNPLNILAHEVVLTSITNARALAELLLARARAVNHVRSALQNARSQ